MPRPRFLFIIATKNREEILAVNLEKLLGFLGPHDRVVVSDASENKKDKSKKFLKLLEDFRVTHLENTTVGISANRNFALENLGKAHSTHWCFFDDDISFDKEYLDCLVELIGRYPDFGFTGTINNLIPRSPGWLGYLNGKPAVAGKPLLIVNSVGTWLPIGLLEIFRYEGLVAYGYDEYELSDKIRKAKIKVLFDPSLKLHHLDHGVSSGKEMSDYALSLNRIRLRLRSKVANEEGKISCYLFIALGFAHLLYRQVAPCNKSTLSEFRVILVEYSHLRK